MKEYANALWQSVHPLSDCRKRFRTIAGGDGVAPFVASVGGLRGKTVEDLRPWSCAGIRWEADEIWDTHISSRSAFIAVHQVHLHCE
jgi:hypothetical protein